MRETAVVLGGSGGIGGACVRRLAEDHAHVIAVSRRSPAEDLLALENVRWVGADVSEAEGRAAVVAGVAAHAAPLATVVVASGVADRTPLGEQTEEAWLATLSVNLVGPALLLGALSREAEWARPAAIVLVGSLSARRAMPDRALYGATKAGLEHFGRCIAVELAPREIAVNTISVGVTDTPFLSGDRARNEAFARERIPTGRMALPEEVAAAVAFAASGVGSLTGATIDLDGGSGARG